MRSAGLRLSILAVLATGSLVMGQAVPPWQTPAEVSCVRPFDELVFKFGNSWPQVVTPSTEKGFLALG